MTEDGDCFDGLVEVRVEAVYHDGKIQVNGSLRTGLVLKCSRCLQSFAFPLEGQYEDNLLAEDMQGLDLIGLARELYYASLPLKPLCAEACKGLCPACGVDRNHGDCSCNLEQMNDKLAVLKKLLLE